MSNPPSLAIIGGSGLYAMPDLENIEALHLDTPFGKPSSPIMVGTLSGTRVAFLARHGVGHVFSPSDINYRANVYAIKSLGITRIVSVSACGSLREDYEPGHLVVPDQLFDFTRERKRSFFEDGLVAHVSVANPFCEDLSRHLLKATRTTGAKVHQGGKFITIEGPRFSTRGESNAFRTWGMDLIGMTTSPEAFLAREAEICYTVMAHVTDYDVWHVSAEPVSVEMIIRVLNENVRHAQQAIRYLAGHLTSLRDCECESALSSALITNPNYIPPDTRAKLSILVDKYLG